MAAATWPPRVTVATVVARDGRFLFVEEHAQGRLVVNQPAGHLDPGETLAAAAVRETLEETAWHVELTALVAIYQWTSADDGVPFLRFTFAGDAVRHEPTRPLDTGIVRALWLTPDELASAHVARSPLVRRSLDDFIAGRRAPLSLLDAIEG